MHCENMVKHRHERTSKINSSRCQILKVVIFDDYGGSSYDINSEEQIVANPQRALEKFSSEFRSSAPKYVGAAIGSFASFGFMGFLFSYFQLTWILIPLPSFIWSFLFFLAGGILFSYFLFIFFVLFGSSRSEPEMHTPEATLKTFIGAISANFWNRAYNCLTDYAQQIGSLNFKRVGYLENNIGDVRIDSVESLKNSWKFFGFSWTPKWTMLNLKSLDPHTVKAKLPFNINWYDKKYVHLEHRVVCTFVLVERGGFWFLSNGFFWPSFLE
jgi:hypothetical protein